MTSLLCRCTVISDQERPGRGRKGNKMRYTVNVRRSTEDEWSDEYYSEPYIEAESKEEAEDIAKAFIQDCGYNPDEYDYQAVEYNR